MSTAAKLEYLRLKNPWQLFSVRKSTKPTIDLAACWRNKIFHSDQINQAPVENILPLDSSHIYCQ